MSRWKKAWQYWNTVKRLKPIQIRYQIQKRICHRKKLLQKIRKLEVPETVQISISIPELDCEPAYRTRFDTEKLLKDEITILHETYRLTPAWQMPQASHLWNYNLHYLEFLIPLAAEYTDTGEEQYFIKWRQLAESWLGQTASDSMEPYPVSMRIPNLLICMELLGRKLEHTDMRKRLLDSIYRQYRYLLENQELSLLANHYFENLKTIVICSLLYGELELYHKYYDLFLKQTDEQILQDGIHFERSMTYHKIILESILRVYTVLKSAGHACDAEKLIPQVRAMASALFSLERGFGGRTPLFNDAGNNAGKDSRQLLSAVQRICGYDTRIRNSFGYAGYYTMSADKAQIFSMTRETVCCFILFDCGDIGPSYMGGHAHCDCLSFELALNGKIMFANSGTGCYQGGLRAFFRSTMAHNTMMIDEREQAELWGEHRAGRRMKNIRGMAGPGMLAGTFDSYLGDRFHRTIQWDDKGSRLSITDQFLAHDSGLHTARQFFHLAPGWRYEKQDTGAEKDAVPKQIRIWDETCLRAVLTVPPGSRCYIYRSGTITDYAQDFGLYQKKQVLEIRTKFERSIRLRVSVKILNAES